MESIELQQTFFQHIKSRLPAHLALVDEVAELLNISNDSAYRRIRGEKPLSFEEVQKLCRQFQISLDHVLNINSTSTVFYGSWVDKESFDFDKYLLDMLHQLQAMQKSPGCRMYYEAKDIPPFHHFQFPELAAFKYFFWMRTILQYADYNKICFEEHPLSEALHKTGKEIIDTYNKIPSIEIWGVETLNSSLRQIEFYKDSGVFKKKDTVMNLYNQLEKLILHIEEQAEKGVKFRYGHDAGNGLADYQLFFNEVILGHNTILAEAGVERTVFINHGVLNYMITRDKRFCDYTKQSLENIMRKSSLISSVSEKERNRFFNVLKEKINRRKTHLVTHPL
jgi:hypothetical protein